MFVEQVLTERLGDVGKKLHTARSRNDQVALDLRMYLREQCDAISAQVKTLIEALVDRAAEYKSAIMPGYTHLQRAQPITFGHHLMAYAMMLLRDRSRLADCRKRMNRSPIGCCALAGTTYPTDRAMEAAQLGFDGICMNSLDGVSDRDFCAGVSQCVVHPDDAPVAPVRRAHPLEQAGEFGFVELSDALHDRLFHHAAEEKFRTCAELVRGQARAASTATSIGLLTMR